VEELAVVTGMDLTGLSAEDIEQLRLEYERAEERKRVLMNESVRATLKLLSFPRKMDELCAICPWFARIFH
jgi:hypothetical protein